MQLTYHEMLDITAPKGDIEIKLREDKKVLWINVEGRCVLRICRISGKVLAEGIK